MAGEYPAEIANNPSLCGTWGLLDDAARAAILLGMRSQNRGAPVGASSSAAVRSPRGRQPARTRSRRSANEDEDGYGGDQELGTNHRPPATSILRRRSLVDAHSGPETIRRRTSQSGAYMPIDPVLLQEDRESAAERRSQQLETRLMALEAQLGSAEPVATARAPVGTGEDRRTNARGRGGGRSRVSRRPRIAAPEDADDSGGEVPTHEVYCPDPSAVKDDSDPLHIVTVQHKDTLSTMQRKALSRCQAAVQVAFREVTGVLAAKDPWPKWTSDGEWTGPGLAVHFGGTVKHPVNRTLFRRVAAVAMQDLKKDSGTHATWMNAPDVKLTLGLLVEVAKGTFRGFKTPFLAQEDGEAKQRLENNARASRWLNRRRKKSQNYRSAIPAYLEIHGGLDPSALVLPDWMSDEASGPEDVEAESLLQWKRRMAEKDGQVGITDEVLKKKAYLETVQPKWRSEALTDVYHKLRMLWYDSLSVRFASAMTPRISTSNRSTNMPPPYAPYNFGINEQWFDQYKNDPTYKISLRSWGTFEDPPGFGTAAEGAEPPPGPVDLPGGVVADAT